MLVSFLFSGAIKGFGLGIWVFLMIECPFVYILAKMFNCGQNFFRVFGEE